VAGGTFAAAGAGVSFQPAAGFVGTASAQYTVTDSAGRISNPAILSVIVKSSPTAAITLFSFEGGTEGWAPADWNPALGSVEQSAAFVTDGAAGLQVNAAGHWYGVVLPAPVDLRTGSAGTSTQVALKLGDSYTWCEGGGWAWNDAGTTTTVTIDLLKGLGCGSPELGKVQAIYIWFNPGTFHIDNLRAE
jgi:mannan endo-1,4-beta-mannosidase